MTIRVIAHPGAAETVQLIAEPGLRPAAAAIARTIAEFVPVHTGAVQDSYHPTIDEQAAGSIRVHVGSPFWHWLEYGTRFSPAYRPVERAVRSLGLSYEPQ